MNNESKKLGVLGVLGTYRLIYKMTLLPPIPQQAEATYAQMVALGLVSTQTSQKINFQVSDTYKNIDY